MEISASSIEWTSSVDGPLVDEDGNPADSISIDVSTLTPGPHTITASATDMHHLTHTVYNNKNQCSSCCYDSPTRWHCLC